VLWGGEGGGNNAKTFLNAKKTWLMVKGEKRGRPTKFSLAQGDAIEQKRGEEERTKGTIEKGKRFSIKGEERGFPDLFRRKKKET